MQSDDISLKLLLNRKIQENKLYQAAAKIQARTRCFLMRKRFLTTLADRHHKAKLLQKYLRFYFERVIVPTRQLIRERKVAGKIQKMLRGYLARRLVTQMRREIEMMGHFEYFDKVKQHMELEAILKIHFYLGRYARKNRLKRMEPVQKPHDRCKKKKHNAPKHST